jgi:hypothetical protein
MIPEHFLSSTGITAHLKRFLTSVSDPDPHLMGSWIRIRIANADPDPEGGKSAKKEEKVSLKTRTNYIN